MTSSTVDDDDGDKSDKVQYSDHYAPSAPDTSGHDNVDDGGSKKSGTENFTPIGREEREKRQNTGESQWRQPDLWLEPQKTGKEKYEELHGSSESGEQTSPLDSVPDETETFVRNYLSENTVYPTTNLLETNTSKRLFRKEVREHFGEQYPNLEELAGLVARTAKYE